MRGRFGKIAKQCAGAMFDNFSESEKIIKISLFLSTFPYFWGPGKVFATRPPHRSGFGNNAKQCAGAMFGIFFGSEKNIVFSLFPFGDPGKVFATRPPQRSGFGNNAKQCAGAMFGIFFWVGKILVFALFLSNCHYHWGPWRSQGVCNTSTSENSIWQPQQKRCMMSEHLPTLDILFKLVKFSCLPRFYLCASGHFVAGVSGTSTPQSRGGATITSGCFL